MATTTSTTRSAGVSNVNGVGAGYGVVPPVDGVDLDAAALAGVGGPENASEFVRPGGCGHSDW